jgi:hypothetical protein
MIPFMRANKNTSKNSTESCDYILFLFLEAIKNSELPNLIGFGSRNSESVSNLKTKFKAKWGILTSDSTATFAVLFFMASAWLLRVK